MIKTNGKRTLFTAKDGYFVVMYGGETLYRGRNIEKAVRVFEGKVQAKPPKRPPTRRSKD